MTLPMPSTPKHDTTLPISKRKIEYRPFLVKEEKLLLMANDSGDVKEIISTTKDIVKNCTFNKIDVGDLITAEFDLLFLKIRGKSIGDEVESVVTCKKCQAEINYTVDITKATITNGTPKLVNQLSGDTIVVMKLPTVKSSDKALENGVDENSELRLVASCMESISVGEEMVVCSEVPLNDLVSWLENLTSDQAEKLGEFISSLPVLTYDDTVTCKCGEHIKIHMEGLESFFV